MKRFLLALVFALIFIVNHVNEGPMGVAIITLCCLVPLSGSLAYSLITDYADRSAYIERHVGPDGKVAIRARTRLKTRTVKVYQEAEIASSLISHDFCVYEKGENNFFPDHVGGLIEDNSSKRIFIYVKDFDLARQLMEVGEKRNCWDFESWSEKSGLYWFAARDSMPSSVINKLDCFFPPKDVEEVVNLPIRDNVKSLRSRKGH